MSDIVDAIRPPKEDIKSDNHENGVVTENIQVVKYLDRYIKENPDSMKHNTITYYKSTLLDLKENRNSVKTFGNIIRDNGILDILSYLLKTR